MSFLVLYDHVFQAAVNIAFACVKIRENISFSSTKFYSLSVLRLYLCIFVLACYLSANWSTGSCAPQCPWMEVNIFFNLPARLTRVGYQSVIWKSSLHLTPVFWSILPWTRPTPLTPPSQRLPFCPRRGQLYPPWVGSPPLSVVTIVKVWFHRLKRKQRSTTFS